MEHRHMEQRHPEPRHNGSAEHAPHDSSQRCDDAAKRIAADYLEMPGLSVTIEQGARLWHLEPSLCREALSELARKGLVARDGPRYRRR